MADPTIPEYLRQYVGDYDESKWRWDAGSLSLVDRYTGGSLSYADVPDPSKGTDVVTDLSGYNRNGPADAGTAHFDEGEQPFIGFPGESYNAGRFPDSGIFVSADPAEIHEYNESARDRDWQGIARVAAIVGGGAAIGAATAGPAAAAGEAAGEAAGAAGAGTGVGGAAAAAGGTSAVGGAASIASGAAAAVPALSGPAATPPVPTIPTTPTPTPPTTPPPVSRFTRVLDILQNNRDLIGTVLGGITDELGADRAAERNMELLRERQALTSANYQGANPAKAFRGLAPGTSTVKPVERFDRYSGWEYVYDQKLGRIVKQPVQQAPQGA